MILIWACPLIEKMISKIKKLSIKCIRSNCISHNINMLPLNTEQMGCHVMLIQLNEYKGSTLLPFLHHLKALNQCDFLTPAICFLCFSAVVIKTISAARVLDQSDTDSNENVTYWALSALRSTDFVTVIHGLKLRTICSFRKLPSQGKRWGLTAVPSLLSEVHPKLSKGQQNSHTNKIVADSLPYVPISVTELTQQLSLVLSCVGWTT